MTSNRIKRRTPSHTRHRNQMIAITIRMNAHDLDHFEHSARLQGISLSECLRNVIEDKKNIADQNQVFLDLEDKLKLIIGDNSFDRRNIQEFLENFEKNIESINEQFSDTSRIIKNSNDMIQSNFEQLFDAFFKLQAYIEHVFVAIGSHK